MEKYENWNKIPLWVRLLVFFKRKQAALVTQGDSQFIIRFKRVPFSKTRIYYSSEKVVDFVRYMDEANNEKD